MPLKKKNTAREWFNTLFYGGLIAIIFRSFLLEPFNIPSGSMIPSLHVGDHIFVKKWSYGYSRYSFPFGSWNLWNGRFWVADDAQVGDIVVFRKPGDNIEYVKRLIGMPGDTVKMTNGRLYINGQMVERKNPRPYVWAVLPKEAKRGEYKYEVIENGVNKIFEIDGNEIFVDNKPADFNYTIQYDSNCRNFEKKLNNWYYEGPDYNLPKSESEKPWKPNPDTPCGIFVLTEFTEVLPNGIEHNIIEVSDNEGIKDTTPEYTVPENHYFFMGDNRDNSGDSRFDNLGFVPRDNLLGRAWFVWYSHNYYSPMLFFWNWGDKMRWDRFGIGKTKLGMTKAE